MCVIVVCEESRPSSRSVDLMWKRNPHGGGIAWREEIQEFDGNDTVTTKKILRFKKGLDLSEMQDLIKTLPLPFVAHFRIQTVGGTTKFLTHPFPVGMDTDLRLEGTAESVLFHNGNWRQWDMVMKEAVRLGIGHVRIPSGSHWSDSRAMAWLGGVYGLGYFDVMLDEKIIVFSADDIQIFGGTSKYDSWTYHCENDSDNAYIVSNTHWWEDEKKATSVSSSSNGTGGSSTALPFPKGNQPHSASSTPLKRDSKTSELDLDSPTFPQDIHNAFRRGQISWELVVAARELNLITKKAFKRLETWKEKSERKRKESSETPTTH